jgi:hypothetical protein
MEMLSNGFVACHGCWRRCCAAGVKKHSPDCTTPRIEHVEADSAFGNVVLRGRGARCVPRAQNFMNRAAIYKKKFSAVNLKSQLLSLSLPPLCSASPLLPRRHHCAVSSAPRSVGDTGIAGAAQHPQPQMRDCRLRRCVFLHSFVAALFSLLFCLSRRHHRFVNTDATLCTPQLTHARRFRIYNLDSSLLSWSPPFF